MISATPEDCSEITGQTCNAERQPSGVDEIASQTTENPVPPQNFSGTANYDSDLSELDEHTPGSDTETDQSDQEAIQSLVGESTDNRPPAATHEPSDHANSDQTGWSNIELMIAQIEDLDINFMRGLMQHYQEKPPWKSVEDQSAAVKTLWSDWERLALKNDVLCRKWTSVDGLRTSWQVVLPEVYRKEFIHLVHRGMTGGHLGRSKTEEQVRLRAYWPNWTSQVRLELRKCAPCAQYHRGKAPKQSFLNPFIAGEPFEVVAVDITGKHPKSARRNEYIVTAIDIFSKWAEAYPVRNHTAATVARVLTDNLFSRFGMPMRILTDQGTEFESNLFQELCRCMGIEKVRTTPYKPSTNGCVERFHRTLNSMIAKVVQDNQRDWDDRVPTVMAAYRAAKHSSTGYSPNFLILGRENRAPIDIVLGNVAGEERHYDSVDEYVSQMQDLMRDSYALARDQLGVSAERRKNAYDARIKPKDFQPEQKVWYFYPRRYVKRSPKWSRNYAGPFTVVKAIPPCDYVIRKSKRGVTQVVHADKLKPCHEDPNPADVPINETNEQEVTLTQPQPMQKDDRKRRRTVNWKEPLEDAHEPPRQRRTAGRPARYSDYIL